MKNIYNVITDCCVACGLDEDTVTIYVERYREFLNSAGIVTFLSIRLKTDDTQYLRIKWVDIEHEDSSVPFVEWNTLMSYLRLSRFMDVLSDHVGDISY